MSDLPDRFYTTDENGNRRMLKYEERKALEEKQEHARRVVAAQANAELQAAKAKSPDPWEAVYLRQAEAALASAYNPTLKAQAQSRLKIAKQKYAEYEARVKEQKQLDKLAADPLVKLVKEHSSTIQRTPPVGASEADIAYLVALANSNDLEPATLSRNYWARVRTLEDAAENQHRSNSQKFEADGAALMVQKSEAREQEILAAQRKAFADEQLGGQQ